MVQFAGAAVVREIGRADNGTAARIVAYRTATRCHEEVRACLTRLTGGQADRVTALLQEARGVMAGAVAEEKMARQMRGESVAGLGG